MFPRLGDGYSVLAQFLIAHEALSGSDEERTARLFELIERHGGECSRDALSDVTKQIKAEQKAARHQLSDAPRKRERLLASGERYRLVAFTPSTKDLARFAEDYGDEHTLARCFTIRDLIASDAIAAVNVPVRSIHVAVYGLLRLCGFDSTPHILLMRCPDSPDVSQERAIVVSKRHSRSDLAVPSKFPAMDGEAGTLAVAAGLMSAEVEKLHVFAKVQTPGWELVIGDDSWSELPSVS